MGVGAGTLAGTGMARCFLAGLAELLFFGLDVNRRRPVLDHAGNQPSRSPSMDRLAHTGYRALSGEVLVVAVRKPDHERIGSDVMPPGFVSCAVPLLPRGETSVRIEVFRGDDDHYKSDAGTSAMTGASTYGGPRTRNPPLSREEHSGADEVSPGEASSFRAPPHSLKGS